MNKKIPQKIQVAIIGAGTAGLSAQKEVAKVTDDYLVFDKGPLGTTCARVGCMPSKVLIHIANSLSATKSFATMGIGIRGQVVDHKLVMQHVRDVRNRFVRGVMADMDAWQKTHLIKQNVTFVTKNTIKVGTQLVKAHRIIIATGSRPEIPAEWLHVRHRLIDSNAFFELASLPESIAIIGAGPIGAELGQALARLGIKVVVITTNRRIGGLTDPAIQTAALEVLGQEFPIDVSGVKWMKEVFDHKAGGKKILQIATKDHTYKVDLALIATGRKHNLDNLGLGALDLQVDDEGIPKLEEGTYRIKGTPIYIAGDANNDRAILHEASDEGHIAGHNAVSTKPKCFKRRTALAITFTSPNIAIIGKTYKQLKESKRKFVTGHAAFLGQGRAIIKHQEAGKIHIYADAQKGLLLGAEIFGPDGEHHAHLLTWAIESKLTVRQALAMPFYHPSTEEALRTALRRAAEKLQTKLPPLEVLRCGASVVKQRHQRTQGR